MPLQVFYGGTFDPVHNGHLAIARAVRDDLDAQVRLLPAADPPHKQSTHADADDRARMLDLAVEGEPGLTVDRRELSRDGPSYSVDTLREVRAALGPLAPVAWLIGSDSLVQLHSWQRWRELFDQAHVLVVERPGSSVDVDALAGSAPEVLAEIQPRWRPARHLKASPAGGFAVLTLAQMRPESSTQLRARIAAGASWQEWLPATVAAFIRRRRLYVPRSDPRSRL